MKSSQEPIIVLIDAAAEARQMVRSSLGVNCRLLEASTAAEGLALIESWKPELVLTELKLPDMDGLALIRKIQWKRQSIVVAVSSSSGLDSLIAALDAGADDFIAKPIPAGEFAARVRVALRHVALQEEARGLSVAGSVMKAQSG